MKPRRLVRRWGMKYRRSNCRIELATELGSEYVSQDTSSRPARASQDQTLRGELHQVDREVRTEPGALQFPAEDAVRVGDGDPHLAPGASSSPIALRTSTGSGVCSTTWLAVMMSKLFGVPADEFLHGPPEHRQARGPRPIGPEFARLYPLDDRAQPCGDPQEEASSTTNVQEPDPLGDADVPELAPLPQPPRRPPRRRSPRRRLQRRPPPARSSRRGSRCTDHTPTSSTGPTPPRTVGGSRTRVSTRYIGRLPTISHRPSARTGRGTRNRLAPTRRRDTETTASWRSPHEAPSGRGVPTPARRPSKNYSSPRSSNFS